MKIVCSVIFVVSEENAEVEQYIKYLTKIREIKGLSVKNVFYEARSKKKMIENIKLRIFEGLKNKSSHRTWSLLKENIN